MLKRRNRRFRWVLLFVSAAIVFLGYFAAPHVVWFWRILGSIEAATAKASAVIGEPATDWHTIDLSGVPRLLADYRGRVVVLDFWYSGCGWCLRSVPQMVALADEFKNQPVAVLGVNWDSEINEASA